MLERCYPCCDLEMGLETSVLHQVIEGKKKVEARLKRGKFRHHMTVGSVVCLREDIWYEGRELGTISDRAKVEVVNVEDFGSFREMFDKVGLENVLPAAKTVDEGLETYYQFYTPQEEKKYGVRGIAMQLLAGSLIDPLPPPHHM